MENKFRRPGWWQSILIGLGCALGGLLPIIFAVAPGFLAYLGVAGCWGRLLLGAAVFAAALYGMGGLSALWALGVVVPGAVCLAFMLRRKKSYFDAALYTAGLHAAGLFCLLCLPDILAGRNAYAGIQETFRQIGEMMVQQAQAVQGQMMGGIDAALLEQAGRQLAASVPFVMPAIICVFGAFAGLISLLCCKGLSRRRGADLKPMAPFCLWRVPKSAVAGMATLAAGLLVCTWLDVPAMDAVAPACIVVIGAPFLVQGLCLTDFLMRMRRSGCLTIGALVGIVLLLIPYSILSVTVLGFAEQLLQLRKRITNRPQA